MYEEEDELLKAILSFRKKHLSIPVGALRKVNKTGL
jgi:hypothetical protein